MAKGITFYGRRDGYAIRPVNAAGEAEMERVRAGQTVKVTVVHERTAPSSSLFWAICGAVAEAMQAMGRDEVDKDWVSDQLKIATGHHRAFRLGHLQRLEYGQEWGFAPRSIDWASMDGVQFSDFLDRVMGFVAIDLVPHLSATEARDKILDLLDPQQRQAYRLARGMPE